MRSALQSEVRMDSLEDFPMLSSQVEIFFQAHLRRALALLEGAKHALDGGHELVAVVAVRCLFESTACIHDFCNRVITLIDAGDIAEAVRLAHQRSFSQRFEVEQHNSETFNYTAINIITQIVAMTKVMPKARYY
jgi:hypothetical protein